MKKYFLHDGSKQAGPFDIEELKAKNLNRDTPIWFEGLSEWTTIGNIEELKDIISATPPPFAAKITPPKPEQSVYSSSSYEEAYPAKKKSLSIPLIIGGVIIIGLVIWLVYQNVQHTTVIHDIQDSITTQNTAEAERQRINQVNTAKNMNFRNNWENYIKVQNSEPTVDYTFGGISAFTVDVSNQTPYMLDQVNIYIQYIRKSGEVYQTKTVTVLNVPAGLSASAEAPSSLNGVKVSCTVEKIVSKKMHFCYPENNGNSEDPFFCK